jgi:putative hydrolase of the HAD superfamily
MIIRADLNTYFIFDLDDTLYNEIDFLKSAFRSIALHIPFKDPERIYNEMVEIYFSGNNTFEWLIEKFPDKNLTVEKLLSLYRNHFPDISLRVGAKEMLLGIKNNGGKVGIITDGRSITQRNKITALGLMNIIDDLVISEEFGYQKPESRLYEFYLKQNFQKQFYIFGDNLSKDFITAKKLGWCCIGMLDKKNLNTQKISDYSLECLPHFFIKKFTEIIIV